MILSRNEVIVSHTSQAVSLILGPELTTELESAVGKDSIYSWPRQLHILHVHFNLGVKSDASPSGADV